MKSGAVAALARVCTQISLTEQLGLPVLEQVVAVVRVGARADIEQL